MEIAGRSDIGLIRKSNQDNYLITKNSQGDILAIVCDGIGGAKAGDVASLMATKNIGENFSNIEGFESVEAGEVWLKSILKQTNDKIFSTTATSSEYEGMGTTFVGALIIKGKILVANVGDSRSYVLNSGVLSQVTYDHSLVYELLASGKINPEDIATHPQRNVLTNALGVVGNLKVDFFHIEKGDKLLLCTDGLSGYVTDEKIGQIINNKDYSLDQMLEELVTMANSVGGFDNITVVLADIGGLTHE